MRKHTEPVIIEYTISIGFSSANRSGTFEIDRKEWEAMTRTERENYIDELQQEEVANYLDCGWKVTNADLDDPTTPWVVVGGP